MRHVKRSTALIAALGASAVLLLSAQGVLETVREYRAGNTTAMTVAAEALINDAGAVLLLALVGAALVLAGLRDRHPGPSLRGRVTSPLNPLSTHGEGTSSITSSPSPPVERGAGGEVFEGLPDPSPQGGAISVRRMAATWGAGVVGVLAVAGATVVLADPRGLYGTGIIQPRVILTRPFKVRDYPHRHPDILVLGSSRARTLSSAQTEKILGYTLYNASVSSGQSPDHVVFARFMADQKNLPFPPVLLVEISPCADTDLTPSFARWPLTMIPYMSSDEARYIIQERINGVFSASQFTEAVIGISRALAPGKPEGWVFGPDGSGMAPLVSDADLEAMSRTPKWFQFGCRDLDDPTIENWATLVQISQEHHSSIVFYVSPRNPRFYDQAMRDNPLFWRNMAKLKAVMEDFQHGYDQVFFRDFSTIESIHGLSGAAGYYDDDHLTPANAEHLIEAAAESLRDAYRLARQRS